MFEMYEKMMPTRSNNCKCGNLLCHVEVRVRHFSAFIKIVVCCGFHYKRLLTLNQETQSKQKYMIREQTTATMVPRELHVHVWL